MLRETLKTLFNADERLTVVAECSNGEEAISVAKSWQPDVVIMDINMPGMGGIEASKRIAETCPGIKILGITMNAGSQYARKMMQSGVMGYVTKNSSGEELVKAVIEISNNRKYICTEIKNTLSQEMLELDENNKQGIPTQREFQVLQLVANGLTSKEISVHLDLSLKTIEAHRYNVRTKLQLKNVSSIITYVHNNPFMYPHIKPNTY